MNTLVFIFKIKHNMAPDYLASKLLYTREATTHVLRNADDFRPPRYNRAYTHNLSEVNWMYDEEDRCMIPLALRREKSVVLLEGVAFCDLNQMNGISNQRERFLDLIFSNISSSDLSLRSCGEVG
jgi:hypothetical protein